MQLQEIYQPIRKELRDVEDTIQASLSQAKNTSILKVNRFLLDSAGKRLRPALAILCAKAATILKPQASSHQLINVAASLELIHMASLIHDDVIDHSHKRHHNATVNSKWGEDTSIALGDYLHALAFKLLAACNNTDILSCISAATQAMCEGELIQVLERDNLALLKERYLLIIKKKTASLFAASCQAGALTSGVSRQIENALKEYGLNFGIAFQIIDDYRDLVAPEEELGKAPGQDIASGELTLPLLNLLASSNKTKRKGLEKQLAEKDAGCLKRIREALINSKAKTYTRQITVQYINTAKKYLKPLGDSEYRKSLFDLADLILKRCF